MLVCHCHRVCDRDIRAAARAGARNADEVGRACRAGTGCGGCRPLIQRVLGTDERHGRDADANAIAAP
jgi:NAD(P)H-nitrite reductase large subunit